MYKRTMVIIATPVVIITVVIVLVSVYMWHANQVTKDHIVTVSKSIETTGCKESKEYYQNAGVDVLANLLIDYTCDRTAKYMHDTIIRSSKAMGYAVSDTSNGYFRLDKGNYDIVYNLVDKHTIDYNPLKDDEHVDEMAVTISYTY